MDAWSTWASGVLGGIAAPVDAVNMDSLWAWSGAESGTDRMRWNNPLNTTQELRTTVDIDPDMNRVGVEAYPTVINGVAATVETLTNGRYGIIVDHLRRSVPRAQWGDACAQLGTWGTGCAWITADYGAAPQQLEESPRRSVILATTTSLHQFVRGTDSGLYHRKATGGAWTPWATLGGSLASDVISGGVDAQGVLRVTVVGTDGELFDNASSDDGATWAGFSNNHGRGTGLVSISPSSPAASAPVPAAKSVTGSFIGTIT
jgi:hypothetical protein